MHEEPTAYRLRDPGVRALFAEDSRYQAWLDVEAAPVGCRQLLQSLRVSQPSSRTLIA